MTRGPEPVENQEQMDKQEGQIGAKLTFPEEEGAYLRAAYAEARVILEYGSGGSTRIAAEMPNKLVISVESDAAWARAMQHELDAARLPSPAIVYHADIGPTGKWGRPKDDSAWTRFHLYPAAIWEEPFFRHPDVALIDGRFRAACFAFLCLRVTRPVRVLFDDYAERPLYHLVERFAPPPRIIGRMAEFNIEPGMIRPEAMGQVLQMFSLASYSSKRVDYVTFPEMLMAKRPRQSSNGQA